MSFSSSSCRSYITDMSLQGFVSKLVNGHIQAWPLTALERNPNLIAPIRLTATTDKGLCDSGCTGLMAPQGEYIGKHLAGIAALYLATRNPALKKAGDEVVEQLNQAQGKDGYLGFERKDVRMCINGNWDLYGHYHAIFGLAQWYQATGSLTALRIAISATDYCLRAFADRPTYAVGAESGNFTICHAYAIMHQLTGSPRYLEEAKRIVYEDWPKRGNYLDDAMAGKDFCQSDEPRWETLHSVMTLSTLYQSTGDPVYRDALSHIWHSIQKTDRHNSGGFATYEKAFGQPYDNHGIETCSCVAWAALTTEHLRLTNDPIAADELELTYFNALLGTLMDDLRRVTYSTPMDGTRISCQDDLDWAYNSGVPDFNCCQANACRALGCVSEWAALTDAQALYLNYYGPCAIHTQTPGKQEIILHISGDYPRCGRISITLSGMEQHESFHLMLRIPSWAAKSAVEVNGRPQAATAGTYLDLHRSWENGDIIELELELSVHYWVGELQAEGKTSVYRGPILLALDERFNAGGISDCWLNMDDLNRMQLAEAPQDCWLMAHLPAEDGRSLSLIDFASAGKHRSHYISWLSVRHTLAPIVRTNGGTPAWLNGLEI